MKESRELRERKDTFEHYIDHKTLPRIKVKKYQVFIFCLTVKRCFI
jgi:hypothetical protein